MSHSVLNRVWSGHAADFLERTAGPTPSDAVHLLLAHYRAAAAVAAAVCTAEGESSAALGAAGHLCIAGRCAVSHGAYGPALALLKVAGTLLDEASIASSRENTTASAQLAELLVDLGPVVQCVCGPVSSASAALYCGLRRLSAPPRGTMGPLEAFSAAGLSAVLAARGKLTPAAAVAAEIVARAPAKFDRGAGWIGLAAALLRSGDAVQALECAGRALLVAARHQRTPSLPEINEAASAFQYDQGTPNWAAEGNGDNDDEPGGVADEPLPSSDPDGIPRDDVDLRSIDSKNTTFGRPTGKQKPELDSEIAKESTNASRRSSKTNNQRYNCDYNSRNLMKLQSSHHFKNQQEQCSRMANVPIWLVNGIQPEVMALAITACALARLRRIADAQAAAQHAEFAASACRHPPTHCQVPKIVSTSSTKHKVKPGACLLHIDSSDIQLGRNVGRLLISQIKKFNTEHVKNENCFMFLFYMLSIIMRPNLDFFN